MRMSLFLAAMLLASPALAEGLPKRSAISNYEPVSLDYKSQNFELGLLAGGTFGNQVESECQGCVSEFEGYTAGVYANWMQRPNEKMTYGLEIDALKLWNEDTSAQWLTSFRARAGYYITPAVMAYGTGGVAWEMQSNTFGWVAGAGIEYTPVKNVALRFEYLHYEMDTEEFCAMERMDMLRMGVGWKF